MSTLKYLSQYFSTTLNVGGGIDASQTTGIILQSVSGVTDITKPGQICITYSDPIDTSVAEWIDYTSINGSNELVGAVRGREGFSAHAHLQGATVVFVLSASHHNDIVDLLNGTEAGIKVKTAIYDENGNEVIKTPATTSAVNEVTVTNAATGNAVQVSATGGDTDISLEIAPKGAGAVNITGKIGGTAIATGAEVTTGTDDTQIVTPKSLGDAGVNTRLASKVVAVSRDVATTGDLAVTGVGFVPTSIILFLTIGGTKNISNGMCDSSLAEKCVLVDYAGNGDYTPSYVAFFNTAASQVARAVVKTFDADGFTLTWDKVNSPTGTANGYAICFR